MSEKEKKRRDLYRKNREKWIFVQTVILVVLVIAIIISTVVAIQMKKTYYIGYRENGSIDYDVYLKENEFFDSPYLEKNQSYVASLIDKIITNFNYEIDMEAEEVNYRYSYSIDSKLEIIDNTSNVPIFHPEKKLVHAENKLQNSSNRLVINEIVVIDYDEYNDLASKFVESYDLSNTTSDIVLTLTVDVLSACDAFTESATDTFTSELRIPLTTKTVNIEMTSSVPEAEDNMIACTRGMGSEVFKTMAITLSVIALLLLLVLLAFTYLTRTNDITYAARVKKILSQYKSYIQKINNLFETRGYQIIMVNSFDEMLEIRDTIQAPILMYENEDKTCAKFMIPTDSKLLYLYEIKVEGYTDPEPEPIPEAAPTTIVKPNITNIVRPVVKVVVTPPAPKPEPEREPDPEPDPEPEIATVLEEAEVEIEAEEDQIPEVLAFVEEIEEESEEEEAEEEEAPVVEQLSFVEPIEEPVEESIEEPIIEEPIIEEPIIEEPIIEEPIIEEPVVETESIPVVIVEEPIEETVEEPEEEIEEILASIPVADEELNDENMVEAIDIFWEERTHKTYRYDPDGNTVEQGDVVLVPTRDEASDKDVIREAEVSRGNYKIDAASLDRPLKKIIGVVKRKAEQIFTAMITPSEESEDQ